MQFKSPTNDGGSPITQYIATASPGGFQVTVPHDTSCQVVLGTVCSTPIVFGNLTNGVKYTFNMIAHNKVGFSTASAAVEATPEDIFRKALMNIYTALDG